MYTENSSGERQEPCGTPALISNVFERDELMRTAKYLFFKKLLVILSKYWGVPN